MRSPKRSHPPPLVVVVAEKAAPVGAAPLELARSPPAPLLLVPACCRSGDSGRPMRRSGERYCPHDEDAVHPLRDPLEEEHNHRQHPSKRESARGPRGATGLCCARWARRALPFPRRLPGPRPRRKKALHRKRSRPPRGCHGQHNPPVVPPTGPPRIRRSSRRKWSTPARCSAGIAPCWGRHQRHPAPTPLWPRSPPPSATASAVLPRRGSSCSPDLCSCFGSCCFAGCSRRSSAAPSDSWCWWPAAAGMRSRSHRPRSRQTRPPTPSRLVRP